MHFAHCLLLVLLLEILWGKADGQAFVEDRACGTLYSANKFQGNKFNLRDFDQSINLGKDFRVNNDGWRDTKSIRVEGNCTINICSQTYMQGNCQSLPPGDHRASQINLPIQSANCTCSRSCRCADTFIPKNDFICGRAYIGDGCNACDSSYLKLLCDVEWFPLSYRNSIKSVVLRSGCTLELFSEMFYEGTRREVKQRILENFSGSLASYKINCNDEQYLAQQKPHPPMIDDENFDVISRNVSLATHPGVKAALGSFESGKSYKNAYIVLIGTNWPGSIGFETCYSQNLGECRFQVRSDELGLHDPQLGVINAWAEDNVDENARLAATLDEYLSTHEDLKNAIPNSVVIYHDRFNDTTITSKTSMFQKKLAFVNAMRGRLLDEKNSNLIVVLQGLHRLSKTTRNKPDQMLAEYDDVIKSWNFPQHTAILPFQYNYDRQLPNVNGYLKMENEEYWPMNLAAQLVYVARRGGDPLGQAIFEAAFPEEKEMSKVMNKEITLLPSSHGEVTKYKTLLSENHISVSNISAITQNVRHELFRLQLQNSINIVILKMLRIEKKNNENQIRHLENQMNILLDDLKAKHESDILLKQNEIHELRQELATQKIEMQNEWNAKTKEEFQKLRTELWESVKKELEKLLG